MTPTTILFHLALVFSVFGQLAEITAHQDAEMELKFKGTETKTQVETYKSNHRRYNDDILVNIIEKTKTNNFLYVPTHSVNNINTAKGNIITNKMLPIIENKNIIRIGVDKMRHFNMSTVSVKKNFRSYNRVKRQDNDACDDFEYKPGVDHIKHPSTKPDSYDANKDCETSISTEPGKIIILDFVDIFHIEDHPQCAYDYLEIRDGKYGYSPLMNKLCGAVFPQRIQSNGPHLWLKFHSDDTIEYEGFKMNVRFETSATSRSIPDSCYINKTDEARHGVISSKDIPDDCKKSNPLDVLWTITTPPKTKIHLNFTVYNLKYPNDCMKNYIQVFEGKTDMDHNIAVYCGSVANSKMTKGTEENEGNLLYVRLYLSSDAKDISTFNATYTAFRTLDTKKSETCDEDTEFDCEDNTCIEKSLECDGDPHCRLKSDEHEKCNVVDESMMQQPHILVILIIFSLILSGMSLVFLFKCFKKLIEDHKVIKKHLQESCEDRLDELMEKSLESARSSRSQRASSERDNRANELFKRRHMSPHQPTSIESDFIQETHVDLDEEIWRRDVESLPIDPDDIRIERNGRSRKKDFSKKEESIRKDSRTTRESKEDRDRKEIRDVSVGAPDTKESGCQTRESLFQAGTGASSDVPSAAGTDSGSGARGFSTFGYSGATIARPSPAPPVETSQITIELLRGHQDSQSKKSDRRPMSSETTRSAPDVIIVSKPIR